MKIYINYIYSIICHGTSLKKPLGQVGTRTCVAGLSQQTCYDFDPPPHPPPPPPQKKKKLSVHGFMRKEIG